MKKVIDKISSSSKAKGVSLLDLKKAEKELGALFPEEFKDLYVETNGAEFGEWTLFPVATAQDGTLSSDLVSHNLHNRPENLPADMIIVGENNIGDKLCYRIRKRWMQEYLFLWNEKNNRLNKYTSLLSELIETTVRKDTNGKPRNMGDFTVKSGKLIVTDPCYSAEDTGIQVHLSNVKNGRWTATVSYTDDEVVEKLTAYFAEKKPSGKWHSCDKLIAVDSAQAGIFDAALFGKDEAIPYEVENVYGIGMDEEGLKYYVACSDAVASDDQGGVIPGGAVAMSGYGDGMYEVYLKYNIHKEIVGVMIGFGEEE
ncbi:uncharacterized protein DUF4241 [Planomicrobium soli]|uniref:Uncharacterized protein DUF4241 n=1 Tax=Planomicrobium soli TaxID=1176648 RepID=A0A2P8H4A0_9BACL|nr:SMI1/KNR4 family protein [Planomicrobium soli]PSL41041.1 uncharacterized protein DUF4241 [Planomicrobium soli]